MDADGVTILIQEGRKGVVCEVTLSEADLVHLLETVMSAPHRAG